MKFLGKKKTFPCEMINCIRLCIFIVNRWIYISEQMIFKWQYIISFVLKELCCSNIVLKAISIAVNQNHNDCIYLIEAKNGIRH